MRILQIHNYYQRPGGEDAVLAAEHALLQSHGHEVFQYTKHNDEVEKTSKLHLIYKTIYNRESEREVEQLLDQNRPDIVHAHNTFPLISPSLYRAASKAGIPVVQTLHNFRLLCPSATLFRDGRICEDCVGRVPYPAVIHACYRGNRGATAVAASMLTTHRLLGTWRNEVDRFITLSEFSKAKFVEGGMNPEKISVKPNFLPHDPGFADGAGGYALFAGRLAREKGLSVLVDAWQRLSKPVPLKIAGDGELMPWLRERVRNCPNIEVLGHRDRAAVVQLMRNAGFLVMPSEWYEAGVPLTVIEALACGTPVIASQLPSMEEVIANGRDGFLFKTGHADLLAARVEELWVSPDLHGPLRAAARHSYEARYTPELNYHALMGIYDRAAENHAHRPHERRALAPGKVS